MKYNTLLFDLDGTLTESGIGITRSVAYAFEKMGRAIPDQETLESFIGPPLVPMFMQHMNISETEAHQVTGIFRERFSTVGWKENRLYAGIAPLLKALKRNGAYLAIASAKPEQFVKRIADYFGFAPYFDKIVGSNFENTSSDKLELLKAALPDCYDPDRAAMVGDRLFDMEAAAKLGVHAIGAGYGYGSAEELENAGAEKIAMTVDGLTDILLDKAEREKGVFISFEGADGCGKTTQMQKLSEYLYERGYDLVLSREPGGSPLCEKIRALILDVGNEMTAECEALLYAASRAEHVRTVIQPALEQGKIVLCDRFLDSSVAYQAHGRELGEDFIRQINKTAQLVCPDRTLLFVGDREKVLRRLRSGENLDRIEREKDEFFRTIYSAYEQICAAEPNRVHKIDSDRSIEEIFEDVRRDIDELLS